MKYSTRMVMVAFAALSAVLPAAGKIVSFKDAAKIKSWDAWDDHLKKIGMEGKAVRHLAEAQPVGCGA